MKSTEYATSSYNGVGRATSDERWSMHHPHLQRRGGWSCPRWLGRLLRHSRGLSCPLGEKGFGRAGLGSYRRPPGVGGDGQRRRRTRPCLWRARYCKPLLGEPSRSGCARGEENRLRLLRRAIVWHQTTPWLRGNKHAGGWVVRGEWAVSERRTKRDKIKMTFSDCRETQK